MFPSLQSYEGVEPRAKREGAEQRLHEPPDHRSETLLGYAFLLLH